MASFEKPSLVKIANTFEKAQNSVAFKKPCFAKTASSDGNAPSTIGDELNFMSVRQATTKPEGVVAVTRWVKEAPKGEVRHRFDQIIEHYGNGSIHIANGYVMGNGSTVMQHEYVGPQGTSRIIEQTDYKDLRSININKDKNEFSQTLNTLS